MLTSGLDKSLKSHKQVHMESKPSPKGFLEPQKEKSKISDTPGSGKKVDLDTRVFDIILESIAKGTGTKVSDFNNEMELLELGEVIA